jgi:iron complex outermembrane receptor protein
MSSSRLRPAVLASGLLLFAGFLSAQTKTTPPPATTVTDAAVPAPEEDITVLSVFRVDASADRGYRATNAISGTRLNTPIRDLPMPIEVVTEGLMKDIGATNLREAMKYSAGVVTQAQFNAFSFNYDDKSEQSTNDPSGTVYKFRGFVTDIALRNGFRRDTPSDSVNIARAEVIRGPSALLYGIGSFGGIINYITKTPLSEFSSEVNATVGSDGFRRLDLDTSGPLPAPGKGKLGYRLTGALNETGDGTDYFNYKSRFLSPVLEYRPTERTRILADVEIGGSTLSGYDRQQIFETMGDYVSLDPVPSPSPRTFRWSGPDSHRESATRNYLFDVQQSITDNLTFLAGVNYSTNDTDALDLGTFGLVQANAAFQGPRELIKDYTFFDVLTDRNITVPAVLQGTWRKEIDDRVRRQVRAELNYKFQIGSTKHNLLLGRLEESRQHDLLQTGQDFQYTTYKAIDDFTPFRFDTASTFTPYTREKRRAWDQGHYLVYHGQYFSDRLQIIAGVRHDRSDVRTTIYDPVTGVQQSELGRAQGGAVKEISEQLSASWRLNDNLTVYALRSAGLLPVYFRVDGNGRGFDPTKAKSDEIGLKFELDNQKLSGTISAFRIKREGAVRYIYWAPAPRRGLYHPNEPLSYYIFLSDLDSSMTSHPGYKTPKASFDWNDYIYTPSDPNQKAFLTELFKRGNTWLWTSGGEPGSDLSYAPRVNNPGMDWGADVPVDDQSKGFDTQMTYTPTKNLSLVFSYAFVERKITDGGQFVFAPGAGPETLPLWLSTFRRGTAGGYLENFSDPSDSSTYNGELNKGQSLDDTPRHTGSLWAKYEFTEGALNHAWFSLGGTWSSKRVYAGGEDTAGSRFFDASGNILALYTDPQFNLDFALGYKRKFGATSWWWAQLNVYNVLNDQSRYGYVYTRPINFRMTLGVSF